MMGAVFGLDSFCKGVFDRLGWFKSSFYTILSELSEQKARITYIKRNFRRGSKCLKI